MSRGAIFHHFRDKDALFFALAREDAERMAEVASREGLIQVMRDMLAAPDQFDWLATRLEIARKLRHDPEFSRGWAERSAELAAATTDRLRRQKEAERVRDDMPSDVLQCYLDWFSTGWWPGWPLAKTRSGSAPSWIWWRIRCARVKWIASVTPVGLARDPRSGAVVGPAAAAHRGARLAQHAVHRPVRPAGGRHQVADAGPALIGAAQLDATTDRASFIDFLIGASPLNTIPKAHQSKKPCRRRGDLPKSPAAADQLRPAR